MGAKWISQICKCCAHTVVWMNYSYSNTHHRHHQVHVSFPLRKSLNDFHHWQHALHASAFDSLLASMQWVANGWSQIEGVFGLRFYHQPPWCLSGPRPQPWPPRWRCWTLGPLIGNWEVGWLVGSLTWRIRLGIFHAWWDVWMDLDVASLQSIFVQRVQLLRGCNTRFS